MINGQLYQTKSLHSSNLIWYFPREKDNTRDLKIITDFSNIRLLILVIGLLIG